MVHIPSQESKSEVYYNEMLQMCYRLHCTIHYTVHCFTGVYSCAHLLNLITIIWSTGITLQIRFVLRALFQN